MSAYITSNPHFDDTTMTTDLAASLAASIACRTILVTGLTPSSFDAHFALTTVAHHPKLLMLAGGSASKLAHIAAELEVAHPGVATRSLELDLSSQVQVRRAAAEMLSWPEFQSVDVLVNNARVMASAYGMAYRLEMHFGTNHVDHFLLTNLIMPRLLASAEDRGGRVVNVSSDGHRLSDIRWDDARAEQANLISSLLMMCAGREDVPQVLWGHDREPGLQGFAALLPPPGSDRH